MVAVFTPFENLADPRIDRTRVHDLFELIVVALCGTVAAADIVRFGNDRLAWLRTFLRLEGGVSLHDTFGRVFVLPDPAELVACIQLWLDDLGRKIGKLTAFDSKTLRGSGYKAAGRNPLQLVSAWASGARLTLGQVAVDSTSDEITAITLLVELLDLKGATVTIEAMGCQKEIGAKIVSGNGDYVLVLKGNQEKGKVSYFLSSLLPKVKTLANVIRQCWSIESQLQWVLEVTFSEDASRIRKQHAPRTSAMSRRPAVSILLADTAIKGTIRGKRYRACLNQHQHAGTHFPQFRREIRCDSRRGGSEL